MEESDFMESREVTKVIINQYGEVVALCNDAELWSPKLKSIAIPEIELKINRYYITQNGEKVDIQVVMNSDKKKVLICNPEQTADNILFNLPDCD